MRLNYDCVRDVLLYIADNQQYATNNLSKQEFSPVMTQTIQGDNNLLQTYNINDIKYSIVQLYKRE